MIYIRVMARLKAFIRFEHWWVIHLADFLNDLRPLLTQAMTVSLEKGHSDSREWSIKGLEWDAGVFILAIFYIHFSIGHRSASSKIYNKMPGPLLGVDRSLRRSEHTFNKDKSPRPRFYDINIHGESLLLQSWYWSSKAWGNPPMEWAIAKCPT